MDKVTHDLLRRGDVFWACLYSSSMNSFVFEFTLFADLPQKKEAECR
jgi:hypothetical protein